MHPKPMLGLLGMTQKQGGPFIAEHNLHTHLYDGAIQHSLSIYKHILEMGGKLTQTLGEQ